MVADSSLDKLLESAEQVDEVPTQSVEIDAEKLRELMRISCELFIEFFLHEQLDMPVPEFHKEIWALLTDLEKERVLLAIPRDHAKTTLAKLVVVWYFLFTQHRFCAYLSNTNPIAKGACKDIFAFFKTENFESTFGPVKVIKESENESLWIFEITLPGIRADGTLKTKRCTLRGIGQGQQMRGINLDNQRPDIAVIDDVEDNENTESEYQQKKLDKWMFGPFLKALARRKKILWLGNMLSKTSLLARLSRRKTWNPVVFGCLVKDTVTSQLQPLWPGKWTIDALIEDFKEYRELGLTESWMCEMMNMPGHGENGFTADQIRYKVAPNPDQCRMTWITVDPAFGEKASNDESSIAVHAIDADGEPITVATNHGRWNETDLFHEIYALANYWGAWVWGIEAIAAQKVLIPLFSLLLAPSRMNGRVEMVPLIAGKGDPKKSRISAYVSLMMNDEWAMHDNDIDYTNQLVDFDMKRDDNADDIIDSVSYGPFMLDAYFGLIQARYAGTLDEQGSGILYGSDLEG